MEEKEADNKAADNKAADNKAADNKAADNKAADNKSGAEQLISKKNLLEMFSISYGALYRWKRKGLIPEDWFIKKTAVTGQETYFPKKLILERIELIMNQKDDILLDELAKRLNGVSNNDESMLLVTEFGEKKFRLRDIKEVYLTDNTGTKTRITDEIKNRKGDN